MEEINKHLIELANKLDKSGKRACADAVDDLIKTASLQKVSQYVGAIGYVLKQNRAMGNCVRQKRVSSKAPMQEIVLECLSEYQDGQDYHDTEWTSKYAQVITQVPERFDDAHLYYLQQIAENSNIQEHIDIVSTTDTILKSNDVNIPIFNEVLSSLESLNNVLEKEAGSNQRPFKLAAPQKSWWNRLTSPSEFKWYNPLSWDAPNRERGTREQEAQYQDASTIEEIKSIHRDISEVQDMSLQLNYNGQQLKRQARMRGGPEAAQIVATDFSSWDDVFNLASKLKQLPDKTPYAEFISYYNEAESQVPKLLGSLRQTIKSLKQRPAVIGQWDWQQESKAGHYKDAIMLDQAIQKLHQNPLDTKSHRYIQETNGRLHDKLRHVDSREDAELRRMLGLETTPDDFNTQFNEWFDQNSHNAPTEYGEQPGLGLDNQAVEQAVAELSALDPHIVSQILDILLNLTQENPQSLRDAVRTIQDKMDQETDDVIPTNPDLLGVNHGTPDAQPEAPTTKAPPEKMQPPVDKSYDINNVVEEEDPEDEALWEEWNEHEKEYENKDKLIPMHTGSRLQTLIKIANALDKIDSRLGDLVDHHTRNYIEEYIKENTDTEEMPDFPEFSALIKEEVRKN